MNKIYLLIIVVITSFGCTNAQKKEFSKDSFSKKMTTAENTEITFKEVVKKTPGKSNRN